MPQWEKAIWHDLSTFRSVHMIRCCPVLAKARTLHLRKHSAFLKAYRGCVTGWKRLGPTLL